MSENMQALPRHETRIILISLYLLPSHHAHRFAAPTGNFTTRNYWLTKELVKYDLYSHAINKSVAWAFICNCSFNKKITIWPVYEAMNLQFRQISSILQFICVIKGCKSLTAEYAISFAWIEDFLHRLRNINSAI